MDAKITGVNPRIEKQDSAVIITHVPTADEIKAVTTHIKWPKLRPPVKQTSGDMKAAGFTTKQVVAHIEKMGGYKQYYGLPVSVYIGSGDEILNKTHAYPTKPGQWVFHHNHNQASELLGVHVDVKDDLKLMFERVTTDSETYGFLTDTTYLSIINDFIKLEKEYRDEDMDDENMDDLGDIYHQSADSLISQALGESEHYLYIARDAKGNVVAFLLASQFILGMMKNHLPVPMPAAKSLPPPPPTATIKKGGVSPHQPAATIKKGGIPPPKMPRG
jgi:hypothetical protein